VGEPAEYEAVVLPHLDAAYTLARYLLRDEQDAQDVVQEAFLRALKYFAGFRGGDARAWVLAIVRNTCRSWFRNRGVDRAAVEFDEELHSEAVGTEHPEAALLRKVERQAVRDAVVALPVEFREVIVLRELQGCSYAEIAEIAAIPVGTVMSRLARARHKLERALSGAARERSGP
jgi:RNA polymerase sigma-70 factor (ECF subfamily)